MIEIWEAKIKKEGTDRLPIIIPLVVYHGKNNWKLSTTLGEMINGYNKLPKDIQKYIPNYEYLLYDISRYKDEEIKGEAQLKILLNILRDIFTKDGKDLQESILEAVEYLMKLEDKQSGIEYFETFMRYIFSARANLTETDVKEIIEKMEATYPEGSEVVMTLAEKLKEEGLKEGLEKGRREERLNTAIKLLTKKFGPLPEEIKSKISKLDLVTLEIIIDGIFDYESLEDIKKYIN